MGVPVHHIFRYDAELFQFLCLSHTISKNQPFQDA